MPNVSRVTDLWIGICCCHFDLDPPCIPMGGYIFIGSPDVQSSGLSGARVGDLVVGYCGHIGFIVSGSSGNTTNGKGKAVVGSTVAGCTIGQIITGNPSHGTGL